MARLRVLRRLNIFLLVWRDKSGSSLIEYSLAITLTIAMTVVGVSFVASWVSGMLSTFSP